MGLYIDGKPATVEPLIINELLQGYIDWRKTLGGEKVTNGTFTGAATGWTLNTGWTYNANAVDRDGAGTATMEQNVNSIAGEVYRVEYQISAYTDGSVTVSIGGTSGTSRSSAATFVEYLKAATTGNLIFTPVAGATFTIDNVSVKKVGYVAADGITAWIEDRGATAGKGALHLVTEDGTAHVFGDRVGIGTLYPTAAFNVAVAAVFDSTVKLGGAVDVNGTTWTNTGGTWTIPAVTFNGAVAGGGQNITNIGTLTGTGLRTTTVSGSPQELKEKATSGGPWYYTMVGAKSLITDNTLTSFIQVTVPNDYIGALLRIDYIVNDTGTASRYRTGSRFITIGRSAGATTVKADFEATAEQTILAGGADTIAVTWTLSANTGAVGAQQTFDVQITIDSGDNSTGDLHYVATLLSAYYVDTGTVKMTMAEI